MTERTDNRTGVRRAGAFDIRVFIGSLLGIYGVVLTLTGLLGTSDADLEKADGLNVNLWTGLALLVVAGAFITWARIRPVVVPPEPGEKDEAAAG